MAAAHHDASAHKGHGVQRDRFAADEDPHGHRACRTGPACVYPRRAQLHCTAGGTWPMKRATIRDAAVEAGVSMMTVSRVLNNAANVQPATRARVQAAIDALKFMPSQPARSLRARRSHWIS